MNKPLIGGLARLTRNTGTEAATSSNPRLPKGLLVEIIDVNWDGPTLYAAIRVLDTSHVDALGSVPVGWLREGNEPLPEASRGD